MDREFKSHRRSRGAEFIKRNKKPLLITILIIAAVIACAVLFTNLATRQGFDTSFLMTRDVVRIGLRTDIEGFGGKDENGNLIGFDRDYIDAVLKDLLGNQEKMYEYYPITSQDAGGAIKYGNIDIALGLLTTGENVSKTKGFTLPEPYYTDDVVAVMRADSRVQRVPDIEATSIGVINTAMSVDDLKQYLEDEKLNFEVERYADYESAMLDLEAGRIPAVIMPRAISRQFQDAGYRILAEPLYTIGYCIMLPTGQSAVETEMNKTIEKLKENGTTLALEEKWGI